MTTTTRPAVETVFARDPATRAVLVVDGYGVSLTVRRGHLVIEDGIGAHRRSRRYSRAERSLRRVIVLAHTGHISLVFRGESGELLLARADESDVSTKALARAMSRGASAGTFDLDSPEGWGLVGGNPTPA